MKEWTLMFYFASDNPLAHEVVSQLKALKNAGYNEKVNVVAYFDPWTYGAATHIFDVSAFDKVEKDGSNANDPFIRNLMFDRLWGDEKGRDKKTTIRKRIRDYALKTGKEYDMPKLPTSKQGKRSRPNSPTLESFRDSGPASSLNAFLEFCAKEKKYKAEHYMLFILGHGLVVGGDIFLYDSNAARHSVTLIDLRKALEKFKRNIPWGEFELAGFHSCSMSSLEVAFELQGTAKYMLASQGPAFVGSWPYTQILMRVFNDVKKGNLKDEKDIERMIEKIFYYVMYSSADFMLAGYSFDLCLCDLSESKIADIKGPLKALSKALINGLADEIVTGCILLAHWRSQSYWNENYTDLYDFCLCLLDYCKMFESATNNPTPYAKIKAACEKVMETLKSSIIHAEFVGPESQYSHGFSIFFPWTRPTADRVITTKYKQYKIKETGWRGFLEKYWGDDTVDGTRRAPYKDDSKPRTLIQSEYDNLLQDMASLLFNPDGPLNTSGSLADIDKPHPKGPMGDDCTCGSIKNFQRDTRKRSARSKTVDPKQTMPTSRSGLVRQES